jgi:fucose permease
MQFGIDRHYNLSVFVGFLLIGNNVDCGDAFCHYFKKKIVSVGQEDL